MTVKQSTFKDKLKINYVTKTQLDNVPELSEGELYLVDPEYTGNKAIATDNQGNIIESTTTAAELEAVHGVTSNIQTQLDSKVTKQEPITADTKCKITYNTDGLVTAGADLTANDIPAIQLSKISDVTASAAEVNVLDGITATTTELNYMHGVTSAVQTQIGTLSNLSTESKSSLVGAINEVDTNTDTNATNIAGIQELIPNQASSENQLADKSFVNSSIATNTGNFIGTFNSIAERDAYSGTLTNNDYCFVIAVDQVGNTVYNRYKWTDATDPASWEFEYALNNSSFTSNQWAAINSGATTGNIGQITTNQNAIGDLNSLTTTAKTSLVNAINEVNTTAGNKIADVKINNATIVDNNHIANIPTMTSSTSGVAKTGNMGIAIDEDSQSATYGTLKVDQATSEMLVQKTDTYHPITSATLDDAVKIGVTTNANTLSNYEQQLACWWLGAKKEDGEINLGYNQLCPCLINRPKWVELEIDSSENPEGDLKLLAGSLLIKPNGTNIDTAEDNIIPCASLENGQYALFGEATSASEFYLITTSKIGSGSTIPVDNTTYEVFFDSTTSTIYSWFDEQSEWTIWDVTLPLAIVNKTSTGLTIENVFNGAGYIGHHTYILPWVEYLLAFGVDGNDTPVNYSYTTSQLGYVEMQLSTSAPYRTISLNGETNGYHGHYVGEINNKSEKSYPGEYYLRSENKIWKSETDEFILGALLVTYEYDGTNVTKFDIQKPYHLTLTNSPEMQLVKATDSVVGRSLANRFSDILNVKDYGAIGDGVTDDQPAIQAVIDKAGPNSVVFFPEGTYRLESGPITLTKNVNIYGGKFIRTGSQNAAFEIAIYAANGNYGTAGTIEHVEITSDVGIHITTSRHLRITNCVFTDCKKGIYIQAGCETFIDHCLFYKPTAEAATAIELHSADHHITNCVMIEYQTAIDTVGGNRFDKVHAWICNNRNAILGSSVFANVLGNCDFTNCCIDTYKTGFAIGYQENAVFKINCVNTNFVYSSTYFPSNMTDVYMFRFATTWYQDNLRLFGTSVFANRSVYFSNIKNIDIKDYYTLNNTTSSTYIIDAPVKTNYLSNCVAEIPQDINLELSSEGVLKLKKDSIVYPPGTIENANSAWTDLTTTCTENGQRYVYLNIYGSTQTLIVGDTLENTVSANDLDPLHDQPNHTWYNVSGGRINRYDSNGSLITGEYLQLPLGIVTVTDNKISNIDRVFNGLGYIGHHVFVLPGVECGIPNGLNTDGTLKTLEVKNTRVRKIELIGTKQWLAMGSTGGIVLRPTYFEVNTLDELYAKDLQGFYYVKDINQGYSWAGGSGPLYSPYCPFILISCSNGTNLQVTEFTFKSPVRIATTDMIDGKQDYIPDLEEIRSGAALGATAVQPGDISEKIDKEYAINDFVTNCLIKLPQDINVELGTDGTLTVNAGSKVYIPYGLDLQANAIYGTYQLTEDMTYTTTANGKYILSLAKANIPWSGTPVLRHAYFGKTVSGDIDSLEGTTYHTWYDTANNLIKRYTDDTTSPNTYWSFPICVYTVSDGQIRSIDHVFNGIGYVGHHAYVLPEVEVLIPNGFNSDGTLKTIRVAEDKVRTQELVGTASTGYSRAMYIDSAKNFSKHSYKEVNNISELDGSANYAFVRDSNIVCSTNNPNYIVQRCVVGYFAVENSMVTMFKVRPVSGLASNYINQDLGLTASKALATDANCNITTATTTLTELEYVSGVTSSIQTQLDNKQDISTATKVTIRTWS